MIIVRLLGGLGNQMFQYACGRATSLRVGTSLLLDIEGIPASTPAAQRHYGLHVFQIAAKPATAEVLARLTEPPRGFLEVTKSRLAGRRTDRAALRRVVEPHFHHDPSLAKVEDNTYLDGFWQSEKYFVDQAETIRRDFSLRAECARGVEQAGIPITDRETSISVHIRRGDYFADAATSSFHGTSSLDYYLASAAQILTAVREPVFYVFSDDIAWVRDNLRLPGRTIYVSDGRLQDFEEMVLMSQCRHHIIANSSFSWWGAWLDPRPNAIVCAPRRWFVDTGIVTADLLPHSWLRI